MAAILLAAGVARSAHGQDAGVDNGNRTGGGGEGAFGGVRFPIQAAEGEIELAGRAGWLWREGSTHRVVLDTDVRVVLGGDEFFADAASLWIERLDGDEYQVYGIFRGVRADAGSIVVRAERLPVRGVVRVGGPVTVRVDARFDGPPEGLGPTAEFHRVAQAAFADRVLGEAAPVEPAVVREDQVTDTQTGGPSGSAGSVAPVEPAVVREPEPGTGPVFRPSGIFSFSVGDRIVVEGGAEGRRATVTATGGVVVQYQEPATGRALEMRAERAVVFLKSEAPLDRTLARLDARGVEGIYLEGGVIGGDERWTVRSPRVYLDVDRGRALMLDAVFWTTDERSGMPVYVRAEAVRQESERVFSAENARLANSGFFEPDFFIGVRDLEVRLEEREGAGEERVRVSAKGVTLNALGVPVFWLPGFAGDPEDFPLRQVGFEDSDRSGPVVRSEWDLQSLLGGDWPGVEISLLLDGYLDRGPAFGLDGAWATPRHRGELFAYLLPNDTGEDLLGAGRRIERDGEVRGMATVRDLWSFRDGWTLVTELSHISDETFIPAFFPDLASHTEDFRNRVRLERQDARSHFSAELSVTSTDFIVSEHLLQTPGYRVDRLPEARMVWGMRDIFEQTMPGVLAYGFEARVGVLRLQFSEVSAAEYGFDTPSLADDAFGTTPGESIGDVLRAAGLDEEAVARFDTRHELVATLAAGPLRITPFVVGRVTAYDDSFDAFSPQENDQARLWGAAGITLSTVLQKVNDNAESRAFDIHRIQHIVEPSITLWTADTGLTRGEIPVYDDEVENLLAGHMFRAAVDQTWQTKRGGPGRWRDVDLLKLRTEYVWSSERAGESAIPRWYSSRPELSNPGEFMGASAVWQPTEAVALAGETVYDLNESRFARSSGGVLIQHTPAFVTSVELREVAALEATYAALTARYRLTDKYAVNTAVTYNFDEKDFQNFSALILRRFQVGTLGLSISFDNIRGDTSLGIVFRPGFVPGESGLNTDPGFGG